MQVPAMVLGGVGAMKVGEGGLWAMIERNCGASTRQLLAYGGRCLLSGLTVDAVYSSAYFRGGSRCFPSV
ncbi:hypothetical protein D0N73_09085 [Pseudomonas fluorescens]|nr:hypothetical protein D0N73_09085 [Pseudomonas fluorescens]